MLVIASFDWHDQLIDYNDINHTLDMITINADFISSIDSILRFPPNQPSSTRLSTFEPDVDTTEHARVYDLAATSITFIRSV